MVVIFNIRVVACCNLLFWFSSVISVEHKLVCVLSTFLPAGYSKLLADPRRLCRMVGVWCRLLFFKQGSRAFFCLFFLIVLDWR